jgi:hypothetical protein
MKKLIVISAAVMACAAFASEAKAEHDSSGANSVQSYKWKVESELSFTPNSGESRIVNVEKVELVAQTGIRSHHSKEMTSFLPPGHHSESETSIVGEPHDQGDGSQAYYFNLEKTFRMKRRRFLSSTTPWQAW